MIQTQKNGEKPDFGPDLGPLGPNSGRRFSFFKNVASSATRYHGQLSSCTILEKTNDPIVRKLGDRQKPGRVDGKSHGGQE